LPLFEKKMSQPILPPNRFRQTTEIWNRLLGALFLRKLSITAPQDYRFIRRVINNRLTYLRSRDLLDLRAGVHKMESENRPGLLIEAGCALGGSALVMAAAKKAKRPFYIYDVFGMIPQPGQNDGDDVHHRYAEISAGRSPGIKGDVYYGYLDNLMDRVAQNFIDFGLPMESQNINLIKGLFQDTLNFTEPIALAHIDCDWYDSVLICLERIEPYLVVRGELVIDDYHSYSGCSRAVDEYFSTRRGKYSFVMKGRLHVIKISA
jgi:O-methyltransferase